MSQTAGQLIAGSLRTIGVLASGEDPSSSEQSDGLIALNALIDSLSNEQLFIPNKIREVFPLVSGQQTYTMGSAGNFNTSRPERIENALVQVAQNSPVLELPIDILTKEQYQAVLLKTLQSTYPQYLYSDGAYPLTNLTLWPVPDSSVNNLVLYSWKPLSNFATPSTPISLPPGYERALKFLLSLELAPEYGKILPADVIALAVESKAAIKRMNFRPYFLQVDKALQSRPGTWNWLTGGFR